VKFVTIDFRNDRDVLGRIGLVVGQPFDLQKASPVSSSQPSMPTLAAAMIDPSYAKLKKPHHGFHHAWESKTLDEDHILYAAMDAYLCLNIYKLWMKKQSPVSSSSKEEEGQGRSRGRGLGLRVRWQCRRSCWFYCSVKRTSCLVLFQVCVVLSPQQNYV